MVMKQEVKDRGRNQFPRDFRKAAGVISLYFLKSE